MADLRPGEDVPCPTARWHQAGPVGQVEDGAAVHLESDGYPICLVRSDGTFHALLDECSHGQVELSDGEVEGGYVECWMHGSRFDLVTGIPTGPPATVAVPVYPVRVVGSQVEVSLPA